MRSRTLALLLILLLALILRVYNLGQESLWLDEGWSARQANLPLGEMLSDIANDIHAPLYFLILKSWIMVFGDSESALRSISVIFGCLSVLMIYRIGCLIYDSRVGILSSLLVATSVYHVHYSQEARMYSLLGLMTLLSVYFFLQLRDKPTLGVVIGYVVSTVLMLYTHVFGAFIVIAENLFFLMLLVWEKKEWVPSLKKWIALQLLILLLFSPWISTLINQIAVVQKGFWLPKPGFMELLSIFNRFSGSKPIFLLILLAFFLAFFQIQKTQDSWGSKNPPASLNLRRWQLHLSIENSFLITWTLIPILVPFLLSQVLEPFLHPRYVIGASFAWYILVAKGITQIGGNKVIKNAVIVLIFLGMLISTNQYYKSETKDNWRGATGFLDENAKSGDLLVFYSGVYIDTVYEYYSKRDDLIKRAFPKNLSAGEQSDAYRLGDEQKQELLEITKDHSRIWVVKTLNDEDGLIFKTLGATHERVNEKSYKGVDLYLFEK